MEENKELNPLNNEVAKVEDNIFTDPLTVHPVAEVPVEPVEPIAQEPVVTPVEPVVEAEVIDIDPNKDKPTIVEEQKVDEVVVKKEKKKSNVILVIMLLLLIALAIIFMPQITEMLK